MFSIRQIVKVVLLMVQGIFKALKESTDFTQMAKKMHRLAQEAAGMLLVHALEEMDAEAVG